MKKLTIQNLPAFVFAIGVIFMLIWGANWFLGKKQAEARAFERFEEIDGLAFTRGTTKGFPSRYDMSFSNVVFEQGEWRVRAESLQVLSIAFQSDHYIVLFPEGFQIFRDEKNLMVKGDPLRLSINFEDGKWVLEGKAMEITSSKNAKSRAEHIVLAYDRAQRNPIGLRYDGLDGEAGSYASDQAGALLDMLVKWIEQGAADFSYLQ